jgi:5,10-methylene-tetrahydrofolate dehydrogenase/methenyl tetrahydrofolate cyclohydrolase
MLTDPQKDIDGFHPDSPYTLPLPLAVVRILEEVHSSLQGDIVPSPRENKGTKKTSLALEGEGQGEGEEFKTWLQSQHIALLGKGPTGGGPIIEYFKTLNVTPHLIDSKTKNPHDILKKADIVISAVGRENTIKSEQLNQGVILISVGINRNKENKLHGDYDEEQIKDIASYYTPTPGGVGPVNVAMLWENLLTATEKQTK